MAVPEIQLRFPEIADAPKVAEAVRESMAEVGAWMDWCTPDYGLEAAASWLRRAEEDRLRGLASEFLIVDADGDVLGSCGVNGIDQANRHGNLGYWVRTSATGQGIATRAVEQVMEYAFTRTDLERLEVLVAKDNAASHRVARAVDARREGLLERRLRIHGVFHDAVMYALLRSRWRVLH